MLIEMLDLLVDATFNKNKYDTGHPVLMKFTPPQVFYCSSVDRIRYY